MQELFRIFFSFALFITTLSIVDGKPQPKIVIVGSGLSGMAAYRKLLDNGFNNIIVLEAENRIGGRIYSTNFSNGYVDLGAQWVHGSGNNIIYEIVNGSYSFGLTGTDEHFPIFIESNGNIPDQNKAGNFADLALKTLFSSYEEMSKFTGSIGEFVNLKVKSSELYKNDTVLGDEMIDYYEKEMNIWNGSETWCDLSAQLHCISGHNEGRQDLTWKRDGYKEFFKYLMKQVSADGKEKNLDILKKVQFMQEVTNIEWNNQKYNNKFATVTVNNRKKYFADHVIVTASLGVLKDRHEKLFTPQLPRTMKRAINAMGFGNIGKIFLEFDAPFWSMESDWVGFGFLWTKNDILAIKGTDKEWLLDVQAFTKLDQFPNVIEALLGGYHMRMFENLSNYKIINDCVWLLEKFLCHSIPRPKSMLKTKWLTNKNFLGTYSYNSVKAAVFNISSVDLAKTLTNFQSKPQVLFAGEHTDDLYASNAHGAVRSGFRAAQEIIDYYS